MGRDGAIAMAARQTRSLGVHGGGSARSSRGAGIGIRNPRRLRALLTLFPVRFGAMTHPSSPAFARLRRDLLQTAVELGFSDADNSAIIEAFK